MGKAARNRADRAGDATPRTGAPVAQVFPNFPYERKFTVEEIHGDILPRAKELGDAMRDGMGPNGSVLYIPGDMFELWMIHAALAGCTVDESKAYIRARRKPDAVFEDAVEWVLKKEDTPEQVEADADAEAEAYINAIDTQLRPEVAAAIRRRFRTAAADDQREREVDPGTAPDPGRDFGAPRLMEFRDDPTPEEGQP